MRKQRNIIMATFAAAALLVGIGANAGSYAGSDTELKQDTLKTEERVPEHSIVDEVIWVVGDQPILKSDVEKMKLQSRSLCRSCSSIRLKSTQSTLLRLRFRRT